MSKDYMPRIIDRELSDHLEAMGAVLIIGPKWCGKTTTAMQKARSILKMQDPDKTEAYLATAQTKPSLLLIGENPRLIDEWQMAPVLWDAVRTAVDERSEEGLFILTGSTTIDHTKIMHSGTGRISRMMMRPMSLYESNESNGKISLSKLFDDKIMDIDGIQSQLTIEKLIFAACRGGWPSSLSKKNDKASLFVANSYVDNICESDVSTVDGIKKDPKKVRALLKSYARNIATSASNMTVLKDINANYDDMVESTLYSYLILYRDIAFVDIAICYCKDYPVYSFAPLSYIAMRENDIKFGTNYCAFVKTYILNGCSSTKTAQQLFLHKNTVIYRLEKIKARFNLDVSDIHEQFRFLIACSADEQMCRDAD